jgi:hypothetical protein
MTPAHPPTTWDGRLGRSHGQGRVRRLGGRGPVGALLALALGLPPGGRIAPATLTVQSGGPGRAPGSGPTDRWLRVFGTRRFTTTCTRTPTGMVEWIGPAQHRQLVGLDFEVMIDPRRSAMRLRTVRLGRWRVGRLLGLRVRAVTETVDGGLAFTVELAAAGRRLVAYGGWIG